MTAENVRRIAKRMGVEIEGNKEFTKWIVKMTGKSDLEKMKDEDLMKVASALENGDKPGRRIAGFWRFTHPDPKMNDDDASRQPYGLGI